MYARMLCTQGRPDAWATARELGFNPADSTIMEAPTKGRRKSKGPPSIAAGADDGDGGGRGSGGSLSVLPGQMLWQCEVPIGLAGKSIEELMCMVKAENPDLGSKKKKTAA